MVDQFYGQATRTAQTDDHNAHDFHVRQITKQLRTGIPVKIIAVHGGGAGAAPTVDVQPMVTQIDGQGNQTPHGTIFGIPTIRHQGGGNALINAPKVGDIGYAHAADRDISALKANNGQQSNPGSMRTHDLSDLVYHGAMLNPANPNQAVQFTSTGVKVFGAGGGIIEINGPDVFITGTLHVTGDVIAGTISLQNHVNTGVVPGGANTGPPAP